MIKSSQIPLHRLTLLESILLWEGRLNNSRVRELFDIKGVRASEMIREFREKHPFWLEWNSITKSYHATDEVYKDRSNIGEEKHGVATSLSQYLALIGMPSTSFQSSYKYSAWSAFPDISVPSPRIFSILSEAIRLKKAVQITYMSMREPIPHNRVISPHSLVQAGRRWHVRAFSAEHQQFRDYALGRIKAAKMLKSSAEKLEADDEGWMTNVQIRFVAHPDLTEAQEAIIRYEYFSNTSARIDTCRAALVNYYIQDARAATDTTIQKPPEYQLAVANLDEVNQWLFPVK